MTTSLRLSLRRPDGTVAPPTSDLREVLGRGPWLVVVPHDDDLVLGLGLTVAGARAQGIDVHVAVATDGSLGYVAPSARAALVETRARELEAACRTLSIPEMHVHRLGLPDGSLVAHQGCRPEGEPATLSQRLVALMREVAPRQVFVCTKTDIHPDHRVAAAEVEIACFWASSRIWLDLGEPIVEPERFAYAVYCPFDGPPDIELAGDEALLTQKLNALACFESQGVIDPMVARLRADGPFEYLQRSRFEAYRPRTYRTLFEPQHRDDVRGQGFDRDLRLCLDVLDAHPVPRSELLEQALADAARPLLIVAEGSSQLFPARFAQVLAARSGHFAQLWVSGGREAQALELSAYRVCLVSNSGATRELVELVDRCPPDRFALLGTGRGPLAVRVADHLVLLPEPERVVAATASVFAQALYLAVAVLRVSGASPSLTRLRRATEDALALEIDSVLSRCLPNVQRVFFTDPGHGVGAELALKTMEVAGVPGIYAPGNLLLHGVEEALTEHDLVVWIEPAPEDRALRKAIHESTGALGLVLGGPESRFALDDVGPLSPLVHLVAGLRVVRALALSQGRDPDRPRRARKVGNPITA